MWGGGRHVLHHENNRCRHVRYIGERRLLPQLQFQARELHLFLAFRSMDVSDRTLHLERERIDEPSEAITALLLSKRQLSQPRLLTS